ncbi:aminotransferase class V-fold PLP-dependent enzyme [Methanospirillum hungatei]|uniref:aminotransferase class V-fold PLP-dependent enzyme n=1 Tax=Methanospirillum hungatei TaxID=2203 RepID=UPI0026F0C5BD|nr:aminotransferase class V-fold PLP-dependent enzyme [Methanospirillum hungatei]MCA1915940.1 aminotransferase class V-fold PLP-dependent enzyme [Methanospirillum hungatei]
MEKKNNPDTIQNSIIYANNAATTWPKPPSVLAAVYKAAAGPYLEQGRTTVQDVPDYLFETRRRLANFFNTRDPDAYVFTAHATDSLNLLIHGFARQEKGPFHVITTLFEHNSVIRPLYELQKTGRISLTVIPPNAEGIIDPDDVSGALRDDTKLGIFSHAGNVIGTVQDISEITRIMDEADIFSIIDGAQSAGQIPIDLSRILCDAFVFTGHKYLFGVPGTGGFFLRSPDQIYPVRQGGTGIDSSSPVQPESMPERFEAGTPNFPGIAGLGAGIAYVQDIGIEAIQTKTMGMISDLIQKLQEINGVSILHEHPQTPLVSFQIPGLDPDDIGYILAKAYRIITRSGLHCAPWVHSRLTEGKGAVRISLSYMNTFEECAQIADAINALCQSE